MRAMIALMRQEIVERRLIAAAGLLLGLLPLGMPLLPNVSRQPAADLRGGTALIIAALLSGLLALTLGATLVGRDLGERRLGFFFARPLPTWSIWGGKMAAALVLAWGAGLLVLLPVLLLGDLGRASLWGQIGIGAAAVLVAVPLAHAIGVLLRARSVWLLLDLIGIAVFVVVVYSALTALGRAGALSAFRTGAWGLAAAAVLALVAAGLIQVARGRTDLRRGHRALSLALWGGLLAAVLLLAGTARWVIAAPFSSLERIERAAAAPAGSWITVSGPAAYRGDYRPAFVLDLNGGSARRFPLATHKGLWWLPPQYSADGRRMAWMEQGDGFLVQIRVADLRDGEMTVRRTITAEGYPGSLHLSPDGDLLATLSDRRLVVEDALTGRLLASTNLRSQGPQDALRFLSPGRVRIAVINRTAESQQLTVQDLDIASGRLTTVWQAPDLALPPLDLTFSPDGARLHARQDRSLRLWDVASGRELASIPNAGFRSGAFLPDGRWAANTSGNRLLLVSPAGEPLREIQLPGHVTLGALVAPDLLAASRFVDESGQVAEALLIDLRTGGVRQLGKDLEPAARSDARPGSLTARTFVRGRELLVLDPATGRLQPVPLDPA